MQKPSSLTTRLSKWQIRVSPINTNPIEKCVICKQETPYRLKTHIDHRQNYVEGCGQLCSPCYYACYNVSTVDTFQEDIIF